ncbi:hypothetical protein F0U62_17750 [Cystobacter fuscus]|uniref:SitI3 family protein n=1 Tax=Cystobacter fuscus TaxID=43 RepID=UPI002B29FD6F|nr:hypothetical protein F0U62_17750 [Cystobacter fuscus]
MSIDFRFSIVSELDAQHVLKLALAELGLTPETARTEEGFIEETRGAGFFASANPTSEMERMILKEGLDIEPSLNVHFTLDKFSDMSQAVTSMLQGVLAVLRQVSGDAVLLFNGDTVVLLRRGGHLYLDSRTGIWKMDRLKMVDMEYALKDFPVL